MKNILRKLICMMVAIALVCGVFAGNIGLINETNNIKAAGGVNILLPYYMTENDTLPLTTEDGAVAWTTDSIYIDVSSGHITAPAEMTSAKLEATFADGGKQNFEIMLLPKESGYILSYTREIDNSLKGRSGSDIHGMYDSLTTDSMHLGYSDDAYDFEALNYNTGVLFAKNQGDITKVIRQPYIFRMKDGSFGVIAVRMNETDADAASANDCYNVKNDSTGEVILFTSKDLISYEEVGAISLSSSDDICNPACEYDKVTDSYYIIWSSLTDGNNYMNVTSDFSQISEKEETDIVKRQIGESSIEYAIESNAIAVTPNEKQYILKKLTPVINTTIDEKIIETAPGVAVDLSDVKVMANYSDGSKAEKCVDWNENELAAVDFNKEGTYTVSGTISQLSDRISETGNYPFLAGRADPNVIKYNGKYYFIATNEDGNVNLYIRESDTVEGLNDAKEHLVYDEAKGAEGGIVSISNHWAPELHVIGDNLYMLFGSNVGTGWDVQSLIMKLAPGGDPTNYDDWEAPARYLDKDGKVLNSYYGGITLDMTHFSYNDREYVVWSQRNFNKNAGTADLWIGETTADNPGQLISEPVKIVECEYGWERIHQTVTEGPFVIIRDDKLFMTYSGGATDETYCVGVTQIDLNENTNFLDAASWKKSNYPILTGLSVCSDTGYHGPGHNSYVTDERGNLINVFHARPGNGSQFARDTFLRVVHFGFDGMPVLDLEEEKEILPENKAVTMKVVVKNPIADNVSGNFGQGANDGNVSGVNYAGNPNSTGQVADKKGLLKRGYVFKKDKLKYKITGVTKKAGKVTGGTVVITGVADKKIQKKVTKITIPKNVKVFGVKLKITAIGKKAFKDCKKLKAVTVKSTIIKKVDKTAFKGTSKKLTIKVPAKRKKAYKKLFKVVNIK